MSGHRTLSPECRTQAERFPRLLHVSTFSTQAPVLQHALGLLGRRRNVGTLARSAAINSSRIACRARRIVRSRTRRATPRRVGRSKAHTSIHHHSHQGTTTRGFFFGCTSKGGMPRRFFAIVDSVNVAPPDRRGVASSPAQFGNTALGAPRLPLPRPSAGQLAYLAVWS